jgi:hypothetical protein
LLPIKNKDWNTKTIMDTGHSKKKAGVHTLTREDKDLKADQQRTELSPKPKPKTKKPGSREYY